MVDGVWVDWTSGNLLVFSIWAVRYVADLD